MSEAAAAARDSMGTIVDAVGRDNAISMDAIAAGAGSMDRGLSELGAAEASFKAAGRLARLDAAERDAAAKAYDMAGMARAARVQRGRADKAQRRRRTAAKWAASAAEKAGHLGKTQAWLDRIVAESSGGDVWDGERSEWVDAHSHMFAGFDRDRARWAERAGAAAEAGAAAAGRLERAAAAAKRAAAAAVHVDPSVAEAREAMEAAKEAVESARQAVVGE